MSLMAWDAIRDRDEAELRRDAELVSAVLDHAAWGGGVVGLDSTVAALRLGRVLVLVVEGDILAELPQLPVLAHRHGARLVAVRGRPAHGLRAHGGIGAILQ